MQHGSLAIVSRKEGPAVWQFRWSERDLHGARVQRKRVIGSVGRYQDEAAARSAMALLLAELNSGRARIWLQLDHRRAALRSFRATGTSKGQHLAQLLNQEDLPRVLDSLGPSSLAAL
jgi:hypothetical protein